MSIKGNNRPRRSKEVNEAVGSWRAAIDKREAPAIAGLPLPLSVVSGEVQGIYDRWINWLTTQGVMSANFGEAVSLYALNLADLLMYRKRIESCRSSLEENKEMNRKLMKQLAKERGVQGKKLTEEQKQLRADIQLIRAEISELRKEHKELTSLYRECETVCMRLGPEFGWSPLTRRRVPLPMGGKAGEHTALSKFQRPLRQPGESPTVPFPQKEA